MLHGRVAWPATHLVRGEGREAPPAKSPARDLEIISRRSTIQIRGAGRWVGRQMTVSSPSLRPPVSPVSGQTCRGRVRANQACDAVRR